MELDGLGLLSIGRRKELKAQIAALTEEIKELRFDEKTVICITGKRRSSTATSSPRTSSSARTDICSLGVLLRRLLTGSTKE